MTLAKRTRTTLALLAPLTLLGSCIPAPTPSFESDSPNARLEAIAQASNASDEDSLRQLVAQLDADDPAARLLAITALHKRTGETLGYRASDSDWRRREAFERWNAYLDPEPEPPETGQADPEPSEPERSGGGADD